MGSQNVQMVGRGQTDYVAVIANTPPAAPATAWIVESLGIAVASQMYLADYGGQSGVAALGRGGCGETKRTAPLSPRNHMLRYGSPATTVQVNTTQKSIRWMHHHHDIVCLDVYKMRVCPTA